MNEIDRLGMYDAKPARCESCHGALGPDEMPVVDPNDAGIVYCSPECRDEFVAAAEREVA